MFMNLVMLLNVVQSTVLHGYCHFEFAVRIACICFEMWCCLQTFVAASFDKTKTTEAALQLLRHLGSVLQRDNLKADLAKMHAVSQAPCDQQRPSLLLHACCAAVWATRGTGQTEYSNIP